MNLWNSAIKNPDYLIFCIFDLDPGNKTIFEQVIEAANITKEILEGIGILLSNSDYCIV